MTWLVNQELLSCAVLIYLLIQYMVRIDTL